MNKRNILSIIPDFGPSSALYAVKPFLFLQDEKRIRFKVRRSGIPGTMHIDWADVVVFCRNTESYDLSLLDYAKWKNKKVIYNLDDNFFRIKPNTPIGNTDIGRIYRDPARMARLKEFLSRADLVFVYSEQLLQEARRFNGNVILEKGYFDFSLTDREIKKGPGSKIRITYATSRGRFDYLQPLITRAVEHISKAYGESVEFYIFGAALAVTGKNIHYVGLIKNYNSFIRRFHNTGCSIGLAPMEDDLFHRSKTNIKYREYGACGIAGIYSNAALYRTSVRDGINGLLVDNRPDAWIAAMERLITDPALRGQIAQNAYRDVLSNYSMADSCHRVFDAVEHLFSRRRETGNRRGSLKSRPTEDISTSGGSAAHGSADLKRIAGRTGRLKGHGPIGSVGIVSQYLYLLFRDTITALRINCLRRY